MRTSVLPTSDLESADRKVKEAQELACEWTVEDSEAAENCSLVDTAVRNLNWALEELFKADVKSHAAYSNGMAYDQKFADLYEKMVEMWLTVAKVAESHAKHFEERGYEVEGIAELRDGLDEVEAMLNPSDEVNEEAEAEAIAAPHAGETVEWPEE
jgi:hypothetical protein